MAAKYGPDNPPPYPVTGRVDSAGSASFFVKDSGNVGLVADGAGNVFGINTDGTGVKMYSPINPPPATSKRYACGYSAVTINTSNSGVSDLTFNRVSGDIAIEGAKNFVMVGGIGHLIVLSMSLQINQSSAAYYAIRMHTTAGEDIELSRGTLAPVGATNVAIAMSTNYIYYNASTRRVSFHLEVGGYFNIGTRECSVIQL